MRTPTYLSKFFKYLKILGFFILLNIIFILIFLKNPILPIFTFGIFRILFFNTFLVLIYLLAPKNKIKVLNKFKKSPEIFIEILSSITISMLLSILFWGLVPSIIDRSLSVNILGTLYHNKKGLTSKELNWSLYKNYMKEDYQTFKRIDEQIYVGNITKTKNDKYILTNRGKIISKINLFLSKYFNLDKSSSSPEQLID